MYFFIKSPAVEDTVGSGNTSRTRERLHTHNEIFIILAHEHPESRFTACSYSLLGGVERGVERVWKVRGKGVDAEKPRGVKACLRFRTVSTL